MLACMPYIYYGTSKKNGCALYYGMEGIEVN